MNIAHLIEANEFQASDDEVQQLARQVVDGQSAGSTYLKVLVAACQRSPAKRRVSIAATFEAANDRLYAAVIRGVSEPDLPAVEVNRRATFARTSASTLRKWIAAGGDPKTLDLTTVTKASLRPPRPKLPGDRITRSIRSHQDALLATVQKLEAKEPDRAHAVLTELIETLQSELESLEQEAPQHETRIVRVPHMERVERPRAHA